MTEINLESRENNNTLVRIFEKSIGPKNLILNGDFIYMWLFLKRYWPKSHMKALKQILNLASRGTKVYYINGNRDET